MKTTRTAASAATLALLLAGWAAGTDLSLKRVDSNTVGAGANAAAVFQYGEEDEESDEDSDGMTDEVYAEATATAILGDPNSVYAQMTKQATAWSPVGWNVSVGVPEVTASALENGTVISDDPGKTAWLPTPGSGYVVSCGGIASTYFQAQPITGVTKGTLLGELQIIITQSGYSHYVSGEAIVGNVRVSHLPSYMGYTRIYLNGDTGDDFDDEIYTPDGVNMIIVTEEVVTVSSNIPYYASANVASAAFACDSMAYVLNTASTLASGKVVAINPPANPSVGVVSYGFP